MDCTNCGRSNRDDARFCSGCGSPLVLICASMAPAQQRHEEARRLEERAFERTPAVVLARWAIAAQMTGQTDAWAAAQSADVIFDDRRTVSAQRYEGLDAVSMVVQAPAGVSRR